MVNEGVLAYRLCLSTSFVSSSLWHYVHLLWFKYLTHPKLKPVHKGKMANLTTL